MVMSKRTREKKSAKPQQPAKPDEISVGRRFAQPYAKARLLFDHPHSYREWNIVGQYDVPGLPRVRRHYPRSGKATVGSPRMTVAWRSSATSWRYNARSRALGSFRAAALRAA